jgi:hypothetical protein
MDVILLEYRQVVRCLHELEDELDEEEYPSSGSDGIGLRSDSTEAGGRNFR